MNCIIVLLLLGCWGGCGNGGFGRRGSREGCGCEGRGAFVRRKENGRDERRCPCRGSQERRSDDRDGGCSCGQPESQSCDGSGMIPPPWQEYPQFPRRNGGEDCDC